MLTRGRTGAADVLVASACISVHLRFHIQASINNDSRNSQQDPQAVTRSSARPWYWRGTAYRRTGWGGMLGLSRWAAACWHEAKRSATAYPLFREKALRWRRRMEGYPGMIT